MGKIVVKKTAYIKYFILFFIFLVIGIILTYKGINNKEIYNINYDAKKNIDYQVYLKENNFFETNSLPKGSTYISTLIDYISVDYKYNYEFDKQMNIDYSYYIKGTILADKSSNEKGNYWKKEYILKEKEFGKLNNSNVLTLNTNIKIDYQKYNNLLTSFKQEYGLAIDGKLKVELVIDIDSNNNYIKNPIKDSDKLELVIPLTQQSVDISINTNEDKEKIVKNYKEYIENTSIHFIVYKILGILSLIISLMCVLRIIYLKIKTIRSESIYSKSLRKILTTYDAIIVNIDGNIDLDKYNIINVNKFEELLDAHSEIRMPINYIYNKDYSEFILINDKTAWIYTLRK